MAKREKIQVAEGDRFVFTYNESIFRIVFAGGRLNINKLEGLDDSAMAIYPKVANEIEVE